MPAGRIHAIACVVTAGLSGILAFGEKLATPLQSAELAAGALAGILISPDLDLMENGNLSLAIIRKRSGLLATLWRWFWLPYAKIHSHRGMSHWPLIGTLVRVAYIAIPILLITSILNWAGYTVHLYWPWLKPAFIGLCLVDTGHAILDSIF